MGDRRPDELKRVVRQAYGRVASGASSGCGCAPDGGCCSPSASMASLRLGYRPEDLRQVPQGADLGLGCGNPQAIAALRPGETVLDLGSGGGLDCFLAARQVGEGGRVIGVDMTPEMVARARENAARAGVRNVEFRLGEIEHLPVADSSVDVIISNCVINLSPDKPAVFREAFRVLKPGGRLAITDIVTLVPLPEEVTDQLALYVGCVASAATVNDLESMIAGAGFTDVRVEPKSETAGLIRECASGLPESGVPEGSIVSATITAVKPGS